MGGHYLEGGIDNNGTYLCPSCEKETKFRFECYGECRDGCDEKYTCDNCGTTLNLLTILTKNVGVCRKD